MRGRDDEAKRPEKAAEFRAELADAAAQRLRGFAWLLWSLHAALLLHDFWTTPAALGTPERRWQTHLFELHLWMLGACTLALAAFHWLSSREAKGRVAAWLTAFFLGWSGVLAGVDQLIGAGITIYLAVNLGAALFVTFELVPALSGFAVGLVAFTSAEIALAPTRAVAFSQTVNGAGFALCCAIFSRMLYGAKVRDFAQRRTIARQHAELVATNERLEAERGRSDQLLRAALPPRIVERLQRGETPIADAHAGLVILWADLCKFTQLASSLPPSELVVLLDELFSSFDAVVQRAGLEKIKTVGDGYLAVAGIAQPTDADAIAAAEAAAGLHVAVAEIAAQHRRDLSLRVGIARGEVAAGVLGRDRLLYDLWGDAVNVANRLETAAAPGETLATAELARLLSRTHELGPTITLDVKGKGAMLVRSVGPRRAESRRPS